MRVLPISLVMMALTGVAAASASAPQSADPIVRIFDTRADPGFGDPRPALRTYLKLHGEVSGRPQHFCVIGYHYAGAEGGKWAQVHWLEGRRLVRWEGTDPDHPAMLLRWRRDLQLDEDIVATEADLNGSSYMETRAWANAKIADCAARGVRYTLGISKRRRG